MKARLLVLMALVFAPFSYANIFDTAAFVNTGLEQGCDGDPLNIIQQASDFISSRTALNGNSSSYFQDFSTQSGTHVSGAYCQPKVTVEYTECDYAVGNGYIYNCLPRSVSFNGGWGNITQVPKCPPDGYPDHMTMGETSSEQKNCYAAADLVAVDSCPSPGDTPLVFASGDTAAQSCVNMPDGSRCEVELVDTIGAANTYQTTGSEGGSCYLHQSAITPYDTNIGGNDCTEISLDNWACPTDPDDVCEVDENGTTVCQSGCGSINGVFVCLSGDEDGDGIPDQQDNDCDGDGIPDNVDTDNQCGFDNNGSNEPVNVDLNETNGLLRELVNEQGATTGAIEGLSGDIGQVKTSVDGVRDLLNTPWTSENTPQNFGNTANALMQQTEDNALNAFNETAGDAGLVMASESNIQFISTMFGDLSTSECTNPVIWEDYAWDLCSRAPQINSYLYWILAAVTMIAIFHRLYDIVKF